MVISMLLSCCNRVTSCTTLVTTSCCIKSMMSMVTSNFANLSMPNVSHEDPWLGHCDCMRHGTSIPALCPYLWIESTVLNAQWVPGRPSRLHQHLMVFGDKHTAQKCKTKFPRYTIYTNPGSAPLPNYALSGKSVGKLRSFNSFTNLGTAESRKTTQIGTVGLCLVKVSGHSLLARFRHGGKGGRRKSCKSIIESTSSLIMAVLH